jgi:hypothetical protein
LSAALGVAGNRGLIVERFGARTARVLRCSGAIAETFAAGETGTGTMRIGAGCTYPISGILTVTDGSISVVAGVAVTVCGGALD